MSSFQLYFGICLVVLGFLEILLKKYFAKIPVWGFDVRLKKPNTKLWIIVGIITMIVGLLLILITRLGYL